MAEIQDDIQNKTDKKTLNKYPHERTGAILTLMAGTLWGFSGCCAQYIFVNFGSQPQYLTAYRMLFAGILMVVYSMITDRENMIALFKDKGFRLRLIIFGTVGVMFNSLAYLTAISYTNSGTATILQYLGPLLIMMATCFMARRMPTKVEVTAIALAIAGTFLLATHGNIHTMVINPLGLIWGLIAALGLALYNMLPIPMIKKYGSVSVMSYGMLIAGVFLFIITRSWEAPIITQPDGIACFIAMVLFGTVITYTIYLAGVERCGPVKASMLSTVEPVSATVIMVIWLGESFAFIDLIGFACIFVTVFMLIKKD